MSQSSILRRRGRKKGRARVGGLRLELESFHGSAFFLMSLRSKNCRQHALPCLQSRAFPVLAITYLNWQFAILIGSGRLSFLAGVAVNNSPSKKSVHCVCHLSYSLNS